MHVDVLPRTHVPQWTIPNRVYHVVEDHTIPLTTAASVSSPDLNAVITGKYSSERASIANGAL